MKRIICLLICLGYLLCGCQKQDTIQFYYQRASYQYGTEDGVIAVEKRDVSSNPSDLSFIIALYLVGPHNTEYKVPFAGKAKLLGIEKENNILTLTFTDTELYQSKLEFTLSCACLAMTCMELENVDCVTIVSGERTHSLTRDVLTLYDSGVPIATTEGDNS